MRRALISSVLSIGLIAFGASPADATLTRAEYIAQLDPICQAFVGPETNAVGAFN